MSSDSFYFGINQYNPRGVGVGGGKKTKNHIEVDDYSNSNLPVAVEMLMNMVS